jgi:hypothetical protein
MRTKTLLRRAAKVRQIGDAQALARKREAIEAEAALDVEGAKRRREQLFMSIHYPEGTDPLHRSLQVYGCKPEAYQRYEPNEEGLAEAIEAFSSRPEAQMSMDVVRDETTKH